LTITIIIIIIIIDIMVKERKHSKKRDEILAVIKSAGSHPSAQWVYNKLRPRIPGLSLGTVYRNIALFREEGVVASVGVIDGEERFDGDVSPHPHFVCCRCGRVMDLPCPGDTTLRRIAEIAGAEGPEAFPGVIDYRKTVFNGLCRDCLR
jgi:Fur family peroxide stress response transcriptional regulator